VYQKQDQNKFVAILAERDEQGKPYLPTYYKSRIYIDLSNTDLYAKNFEQLLRWIYDKPLFVKPELGKKPSFLSDTPQISLGTTTAFRRAHDAIRSNKDYWKGALNEYFETFVTNLEKFRIASNGNEFDDKVVESIEQFLPYRNEAIEIFLALAQYIDTPESRQQLHRYLESLIPYMERPEHITSYHEWDYDNFKFIVHELFLYAFASLLKYERYEAAASLLRYQYYVQKTTYTAENMASFAVFRQYMKSLEYRNTRLKLNRASIRADLLEQRSKSSGIAFRLLMQADFILFIRDCLEMMRTTGYQEWWPETMLYIGRLSSSFEIFARAQSKDYFDKIKCLFDIEQKKDLEPLLQAFKEQKLKVPSWHFTSFSPYGLLGFEKLATRP
jgi:hypothetical protein